MLVKRVPGHFNGCFEFIPDSSYLQRYAIILYLRSNNEEVGQVIANKYMSFIEVC